MITIEMYRMMERRQFGDATRTYNHRRPTSSAKVRRIHELLEEGLTDRQIADIVEVKTCQVNYRRNKLKRGR